MAQAIDGIMQLSLAVNERLVYNCGLEGAESGGGVYVCLCVPLDSKCNCKTF